MQTVNHKFVFDDETYITSNVHVNSGLTLENIAWSFTSTHQANWHPVTWISHMTDVQLYGLNSGGHHLTNAILHTITSILLLMFLVRATGLIWQSTVVAALFALHPMHVESVAWVAERKDILSAFFMFLTLLLYVEYAVRQNTRYYVLALISFVLGLMSKPMLVTLPVVLMLIDLWPLNRLWSNLGENVTLGQTEGLEFLRLREKIPFFICSIISSVVTIYAQNRGGAVVNLSLIPFNFRIENALISYVQYIKKALYPSDLAAFYPYPLVIDLWQTIGALLIILFISMAACQLRRHFPYFALGWFWYLVTLLPVIGLIQVGMQSMADRYSYIPLIGFFIILVWGVSDLAKLLPFRRAFLALLSVVVLTICTVLTWKQIGTWYDSVTLFSHAIKVSPESSILHYNLGAAFANNGEIDKAIYHFREAVRMNPGNERALKNLKRAVAQKTQMNY